MLSRKENKGEKSLPDAALFEGKEPHFHRKERGRRRRGEWLRLLLRGGPILRRGKEKTSLVSGGKKCFKRTSIMPL